MTEREMPFELVTTNERLAELLADHADEPRYAFDTEFDNRRTYYARLALVQVAWPDFIMLVDPFTVDIALLVPLFQSDAIAIAHAAINDLTVLDRALGVRPTRLFDTQVAAQLTGMRGASLAYLASELLSLELDKSEQTSDWTVRPLSAAAQLYATNDVAHLFDIADELFTDLTALGRVQAFDEECEAILASTPKDVVLAQSWWHLQQRESIPRRDLLVVQYLAALREELAEMLNITRRYLVPDDTLISVAAQRPRSVEAMRSALGRRVPADLVPQFVEALTAGERASTDELVLPNDDRGDEMRGLLAILQALVAQTAQAMSLEPSVLASKNDLLARLEGRPSKFDRAWRADVITDAVDAVIAGEYAVVWRNGQLHLVAAPAV